MVTENKTTTSAIEKQALSNLEKISHISQTLAVNRFEVVDGGEEKRWLSVRMHRTTKNEDFIVETSSLVVPFATIDLALEIFQSKKRLSSFTVK